MDFESNKGGRNASGSATSVMPQPVRAGRLLICSGQVPEHQRTREMIAGDVRVETIEVMKNLARVLEASGAGFSQVVKSTITVSDPSDLTHVNSVYGSYFDGLAQPASAVQVAERPRASKVEIELIALV
jgi:2-iminobutanoate/2-iminopropanoate deaminase